jgi:hypothetical protein
MFEIWDPVHKSDIELVAQCNGKSLMTSQDESLFTGDDRHFVFDVGIKLGCSLFLSTVAQVLSCKAPGLSHLDIPPV